MLCTLEKDPENEEQKKIDLFRSLNEVAFARFFYIFFSCRLHSPFPSLPFSNFLPSSPQWNNKVSRCKFRCLNQQPICYNSSRRWFNCCQFNRFYSLFSHLWWSSLYSPLPLFFPQSPKDNFLSLIFPLFSSPSAPRLPTQNAKASFLPPLPPVLFLSVQLCFPLMQKLG